MRSLFLLCAVMAGGCAAQSPAPLPQGPAGGQECRNTGLEAFRGQPATSDSATKLIDASGARTIRWVQPGMAITMDYSPTRLTVHLDAQNRIESLNCG
jgi:hypothetical protein